MERSKAVTKKEVPTAYRILIKIQKNNEHNMVIFYKKWKKCNEIHLTKNKMDLNNRITKNHSPSHEGAGE